MFADIAAKVADFIYIKDEPYLPLCHHSLTKP